MPQPLKETAFGISQVLSYGHGLLTTQLLQRLPQALQEAAARARRLPQALKQTVAILVEAQSLQDTAARAFATASSSDSC